MAFDADDTTDDELEDDLPLEGEDDDEASAAAEDDEGSDDDEKEPSVQDIAKSLGWTPRDKWRGDPRKWTPASEFIRRGAEWRKEYNREVKDLREQLEGRSRVTMVALQRQAARYEAELKAARKEAIKAGDVDRVEQIDEEIKQVALPVDEEMQAEQVVSGWMQEPLLARFFEDNVDAFEDERVFDAVLRVGEGEATTAAAVKAMREYLELLDPDRAKPMRNVTPQQQRRQPPLYADAGGRARGQSWASRLTPDEIKEADSLVKEKLFANREEYAEQLFKNRGQKR